jgi:hypothetical protein
MPKNKTQSVFVTKTSIKAQIGSPAVLKNKKVELIPSADPAAVISRATTEIAGVLPYLFTTASYIFENMPGIVHGSEDQDIMYYQLGTKEDFIPMSTFIKIALDTYSEQKKDFMSELYRMWREKRSYWLPTGKGKQYIFLPPIQVFPVIDGNIITNPEFEKRLMNINTDPSKVISGVVINCYKPLFEGHFNNYQDGFTKQPIALYAKIKREVSYMLSQGGKLKMFISEENKSENKSLIEMENTQTETETTALNIMKIWEYINMHENKSELLNIDIIDMLLHVAPRYLIGNKYLRTEYLGNIFNAFIIMARLTHKYVKDVDFEIITFDMDIHDHQYAKRQGKTYGTPVYTIEAMKHHLKANNNHLPLILKHSPKRMTA